MTAADAPDTTDEGPTDATRAALRAANEEMALRGWPDRPRRLVWVRVVKRRPRPERRPDADEPTEQT